MLILRMVKRFWGWIWRQLKGGWRIYDATARGKLVDAIEWETAELENIFGLLVLGALVGVPAPPMHIMLDLLPDMEKELLIMLERVETASAPLSDLASILDVG